MQKYWGALLVIVLLASCGENKSESKPSESSATQLDMQKVAVANSLNKDFAVIAGGPGTGKTYTVTKLLAAYSILKQQALAELLNIEQTSAIQDEKPI